jgi:N-acetyl-gamma-glutamyl-phosphate reductase
MTIQVGILGATGLTGEELVRLLLKHPEVELKTLTSERQAGIKFSDFLAAYQGQCDLVLEKANPKKIGKECDVVFCCLPHQESMVHVATLLEEDCKVIDLSADFRLDSESVYEQWYTTHTNAALLKTKVYGLPELYRNAIREAQLVANPGCYPTATILSLAPLLKAGLIKASPLICDAKSGVSGAGRTKLDQMKTMNPNEFYKPYAVDGHRHTPEMEQELSKAAGQTLQLRFTPHLIPVERGIIATCYTQPRKQCSSEELIACLEAAYKEEPFVRVKNLGELPNTDEVNKTNFCDLMAFHDADQDLIITIATIDNLCKGASGQAVQNMNLMMGLDETTGLKVLKTSQE